MGECLREWSTGDELAFIEQIGTHRMHRRTGYNPSPVTVKALLENYIIAAREREEWGFVKASTCISYAVEKLQAAV